MKTTTSAAKGRSMYFAPDSKIISIEPEGFIAGSGETSDYDDGGELTQMYNGKPLDDKFLKKA